MHRPRQRSVRRTHWPSGRGRDAQLTLSCLALYPYFGDNLQTPLQVCGEKRVHTWNVLFTVVVSGVLSVPVPETAQLAARQQVTPTETPTATTDAKVITFRANHSSTSSSPATCRKRTILCVATTGVPWQNSALIFLSSLAFYEYVVTVSFLWSRRFLSLFGD